MLLFAICRIDLEYNARLLSQVYLTTKPLLKVFSISTSIAGVNEYCRSPVTWALKVREKEFALAGVRIIRTEFSICYNF